MEENIIVSDNLNKIKEVNKLGESFKSNILKDSVLNGVMLMLVAVFFSISFEFTKKVVVDFWNLSWSDIFPLLLDLVVLFVIGLFVKETKKIISNDGLILKLEENEEQEQVKEKISLFLSKENKDLDPILIVMLIVSVLYFLGVEFLEVINHKFSMLNNWYFENFYNSLPIFPLNIIILLLIFAILIPLYNSVLKYREKLINLLPSIEQTALQKENDDNLSQLIITKRVVLIAFSILCLILSFAKENNAWNFKYVNSYQIPDIEINSKTKINNEGIDVLCDIDRDYTKIHNKVNLFYSVYSYTTYSNNHSEKHKKGSKDILISENTKNNLESYCGKLNSIIGKDNKEIKSKY